MLCLKTPIPHRIFKAHLQHHLKSLFPLVHAHQVHWPSFRYLKYISVFIQALCPEIYSCLPPFFFFFFCLIKTEHSFISLLKYHFEENCPRPPVLALLYGSKTPCPFSPQDSQEFEIIFLCNYLIRVFTAKL